VRYDALVGRLRTDDHLVLNVDLAPTFAGLADVEAPGAEGRDLVPLLDGSRVEWREDFLIEHQVEHAKSAPSFCAGHTDRHVLVRYSTFGEERFQLGSRAAWATEAARVSRAGGLGFEPRSGLPR